MGREELLDDPRFATAVARGENRDAIDAIVAGWTAEHELSELLPRLEAAIIPTGPVNSIADIATDPHFQERDMLLSLHDRLLGAVRMQGIVPKLSETPGAARSVGPALGEHNQEVYQNLLGLKAEELARLAERGVI
jgi:crotonobetainyl-CoA:carnitine CoA-transferase CaiB-like acyl-CoA transferase